MLIRPIGLLSLIVMVGAVACDLSSGDSKQRPDPNEGKSFEKAITASAGGTLASPDNSVVLTVPPGSLAADLTLTVAIQPRSGDAAANIYDFGPDGTQFQTPASLSIAFSGSVPSGKKATLAWLDGTTWTSIEGSTLADGKVTGSVSHFTKFTVIFIDGQPTLNASCAAIESTFTPCGGDVLGRWNINDMCADQGSGETQNPMSEFCPTATMEMDMNFEGWLEFDATQMTGSNTKVTGTSTLRVPSSCLKGGMTCAQLGGEEMACAMSGDACVCTQDIGEEEENGAPPKPMPYTIEGNELVVQQDDKTTRMFYCVKGNTLTLKGTQVDSDTGRTMTSYMVLKK